MRKNVGSLAALAACGMLATSAGNVGAQAPTPAPADPWDLRQTPESCYLSRSVDGGGRKIEVLIQSFGSQTPYHVTLRGAGFPPLAQRAAIAQVGFGGRLSPSDVFVLVGKSGDVPTVVFGALPPRPDDAHILSSIYVGTTTHANLAIGLDPLGDTLSITMPAMAPLSLPLGDMRGEYARLDGCVQALEKRWSLGASGGAEAAQGPKLRDTQEVSWHVKFPEDMLLNRVSGLAEMRMTVDAKGRARSCVVQVSTWASRFGEASCTHMQDVARFEPARDAQGNPVSALYRTAALFVIYNWG